MNFPSTMSVLTSNKKSFNSPSWASNDFNWDSTIGSIDIFLFDVIDCGFEVNSEMYLLLKFQRYCHVYCCQLRLPQINAEPRFSQSIGLVYLQRSFRQSSRHRSRRHSPNQSSQNHSRNPSKNQRPPKSTFHSSMSAC